MRDDLELLDGTKHWLGWLGDDPKAAVRQAIQMLLCEQVADTEIDQLQIIAPPHYLTGGRPREEDASKVVVTRAALCVLFIASVSAGEHAEVLHGAFSWVATGLDTKERKDRTWIDLGNDVASAKDRLRARIYEVDAD